MRIPFREPETPAETARIGHLASAAVLLSVSFVLSRVLGVLRMSVIAAVFGNSRDVAAYFAAFRLPDTMFMLVSGGALASAFVPLFAALIEGREDEEAWDVAGTVLTTVLIAMGALAGLFLIFAPQIMGFLVGSGHGGFTPAQQDLTVQLTRIMLLQPIFLGVSAVITSILQTYHRFLLTALAPLIYNLAVIVGALLGHVFGVGGLAWAVVLGAVGQLVIQIPGLFPEAVGRLRPSFDWAGASSREVLRLFTPRVVGLAAFQAMLFVTLFLAARIQEGRAVTAINYSWPILQFPVGALGLAAGTAIFPTLARLSTAEDMAAVRRTVNRSLRMCLFLAIPATVGLVILGNQVVSVLYAHGTAWTDAGTANTAFALQFFSLALAPLASIEILARVFYAMRDTLTPVRIAIVAVAIDAGLSVLFVHLAPESSGQGALALATAVATAVQVIWLGRAADAKLGGLGTTSLRGTLLDSALASAAMGIVLFDLLALLTAILPQRGLGVIVTLVIELPVGAGVFALVCYLRGAPELWELHGLVQRK